MGDYRIEHDKKTKGLLIPKLDLFKPNKIEFKSQVAIPYMTSEEIDAKVEEIFKFLFKVHPELASMRYTYTGTKDIAIHLRAIFRDTKEEEEAIKSSGKNYYSCYYQNIFRFNDKGKNNLRDFIRSLNNTGRAYCLYYGVYSLNDAIAGTDKIEKRREENKRFVKNSLTTKNAQGTHILIADFDHVEYEEFIEIKKIFPFETIDIFTGHGFQSIILLDKYTRDLQVLENFVFEMYKRGFNVDLVARDIARIMRMPYMWNAKEHSTDVNGSIWETFILNDTNCRYSIEEVFNLLNKLPVVREIDYDKITKEKSNKKTNQKLVEHEFIDEIVVDTKNDVDIEFLRQHYPQINVDSLKQPIQLLLQGFRKGYAEHSVMFLTNYFSEYGYDVDIIQSILLTLSTLNTYDYAWRESIVLKKVSTFYDYVNKEYSTVSIYNKHLQEEYGQLDLKEEFEFIRRNKIKISNKFFKDLRIPDMSSNKLKASITPTAMYLYFVLLVDSFRFNRDTYSKDEIVELTGLSDKTVRIALKPLVKHSYIIKNNDYNPRIGKTKKYKLALALHSGAKNNFTLVNVGDIENLIGKVMLDKLNEREFQLCVYFLYKIYQGVDSITLSQQDIAMDLLISRPTIVATLKSLDEKGLLNREKIDMGFADRFVYNYSIKF